MIWTTSTYRQRLKRPRITLVYYDRLDGELGQARRTGRW